MLVQGIIYFSVGIMATMFGAIAGIGGGVIIKPVLDFLGDYNASTISILSSFTVFSMAVISTYKQIKNGVKFERTRMFVFIGGSISGGVLGKKIFGIFIMNLGNTPTITGVQSLVVAFVLIFVLYVYMHTNKIPSWNVKNPSITFLVGVLLGILASFLGIGGGPINVAVLAIFFRMDARTAAIHSILIILFSQSSKLVTIGMEDMFQPYNLRMLLFMIPGGIAGGILGNVFSRKLPMEGIRKLFSIALILIITLNVFNAVNIFS